MKRELLSIDVGNDPYDGYIYLRIRYFTDKKLNTMVFVAEDKKNLSVNMAMAAFLGYPDNSIESARMVLSTLTDERRKQLIGEELLKL